MCKSDFYCVRKIYEFVFYKKMRENFVFRFGVFDIFRMRGDFVGTLDLQMGRDKKTLGE